MQNHPREAGVEIGTSEEQTIKGTENKLREILEGTKQYVVPSYQRDYAWSTAQWNALWRPVERQFDALVNGNSLSPYFLGSLVINAQADSSASSDEQPRRWDIIDGQQRLTTIVILLAALRDATTSSMLREGIDEQILRNKYASGDGRPKILPKAADADGIRDLLVDGGEGGTGRIHVAYTWMRERVGRLLDVHGSAAASQLRQAILDGLLVVKIEVGEGDNPHRIFQTLNSTGVGLSEVDKLRSHFFMLLPDSHEGAHQTYWRPMEAALGRSFGRFVWVDLASRGNGLEQVKTEAVYEQWQQILQDAEHSEEEVTATLKDLHRRHKIFLAATAPQEGGPAISLRRLNEWSSNVHQPLTHHLLVRHAAGELSDADLRQCLALIESFLVRRMLVGTPTNNLNRIFTTLVGQVASFDEPGIVDALHRFLSEPGKYWPTDAELREKAETATFAAFQRVTQRYFVLRRLEEHRAQDGYIDWTSANFTLEHFMPQKLNAQWSTYLRESGVKDVEQVHRELVDTIGNCTLTSLNQRLSNSFLDRKQEILSGSTLHLNTEIAESADWLPENIRPRSRRLIDDAIEIWEGPLATVSDSSAPDLSAVEAALAALTGAEWTSAHALAEACEVSYDDVVAYLDEARPIEHQRVLNDDGVPDPRRAWVRDEGLTAIGEHLVALGVLSSTLDLTADKSLFVDGTAIAERVGA